MIGVKNEQSETKSGGEDGVRSTPSRYIVNYQIIKYFAKKHKCPTKKLIALTEQNDPYCIGSPTEVRAAKWIADIVTRYLESRDKDRVHDRAIHYYILSSNLQRPIEKDQWKTYTGDRNDFAFAMKAIQNARILGYIPWEVIEDKKNPELYQAAKYWADTDPTNLTITIEDLIQQYIKSLIPINHQTKQKYHVEIWTEKTTIDDLLLPIAKKYGANIQPFSGQATHTKVWELVHRLKEIGKPVRILYISDYDKYGHNMPVASARKLQWFIDDLISKGKEYDVKLEKILLTNEQVTQYNLPWAPDEEGKVELDALEVYHPGETSRIVENEVVKYIDLTLKDKVMEQNLMLRKMVADELHKVLDPIGLQIKELDFSGIELDELPEPKTLPESTDMLYDSSRDYFAQTKRFKQFLRLRKDSA